MFTFNTLQELIRSPISCIWPIHIEKDSSDYFQRSRSYISPVIPGITYEFRVSSYDGYFQVTQLAHSLTLQNILVEVSCQVKGTNFTANLVSDEEYLQCEYEKLFPINDINEIALNGLITLIFEGTIIYKKPRNILLPKVSIHMN